MKSFLLHAAIFPCAARRTRLNLAQAKAQSVAPMCRVFWDRVTSMTARFH